MKNLELVSDILKNNNGIITTREAVSAGITKPLFYLIADELGLRKTAHGVYVSSEDKADNKYIVQLKYPKAVVSHDSAAYIHGLLQREPMQISVTLNTGINPGRLTAGGIKVYTIKEELLNLGKTDIKDEYGQPVAVYDLERTVCDIVRSRKKLKTDTVSAVLKAYARRSDRDIVKLMLYARSFRIRNIMRDYMELIL